MEKIESEEQHIESVVNENEVKDPEFIEEEKQIEDDNSEERVEKELHLDKKAKSKRFYVMQTQNYDELDPSKLKFYSNRIYDIEKLKSLLKIHLTKQSGIYGIKNLGNTCYINTIIISLINCLDLVYYVFNKDYEKDLNPKSPFVGNIATKLFNLIEASWTSKRIGNNLDQGILVPFNFRQSAQSLSPLFVSNNQQDPHEFLILLLDALNSDLSIKKEKLLAFGSLLNPKSDDESDFSASRRFWLDHRFSNSSAIADMFHGQFKKTIICPDCVNHTITFEGFSTIDLALPSCFYVTFNLVKNYETISFDVLVSDAATFFDAENYINTYLDKKIKKIRYVLSNSNTQRLIKSSENIVSLSKKGNLLAFEINQDLYGDDYFPLLLFFIERNEISINDTLKINNKEKLEIENDNQQQLIKDKKDEKEEKEEKSKNGKNKKNNQKNNQINDNKEKENDNDKKNPKTDKKDQKVKNDKKDQKDKKDNKNKESKLDKKESNKIPNNISKKPEILKSFNFLSYSRVLPIDPYYTISELKQIVFLYILNHLSNKYTEQFNEEIKELNETEDKDDPSFWESLSSLYSKFQKKFLLPYILYISNENEFVQKVDYKKILINSFKDKQLCEELFSQMKNGMKFYIEFLKDFDKEQVNLNKIIRVKREGEYEEQSQAKEISLDDCFKHFQLFEKLDKQNESFCNQCNKRQCMFIKTEPYYLPKNLIISFKRHEASMINQSLIIKKNTTLVKYPVNSLVFDTYIPTEYELFSVCQHSGSNDGGHYFTNVKNKGAWYGVDDNTVFSSDEDSIVIEESYILFYRRKLIN